MFVVVVVDRAGSGEASLLGEETGNYGTGGGGLSCAAEGLEREN